MTLLPIIGFLYLSFIGTAFGVFVNLLFYYVMDSLDMEYRLGVYRFTKWTFLIAWPLNTGLHFFMVWLTLRYKHVQLMVSFWNIAAFFVVVSVVALINYRRLRVPVPFEEWE
ncbi:hypothetical protein [Pontibacter litorisediminis]|uniref:hypothetical protein n=1 Tax=Pontibacter litorisediminis TaxID=1846260 RepID=UPI0023ECF682|nr:hypothetical protein [Pontibacter litorisediminis]